MTQRIMREARVRDLNGRILFVQPKGTELAPGHLYIREDDKPKLKCTCCDAPVIYREPTVSSGGSTYSGRAGYFSLPPKGKHEEGCEIVTRPARDRHIMINPLKGYRIHLNTRYHSDLFNDEANGVYGPNHRVPDDLKDREIRVIKSADDLVKLIQEGNYERLNDSKVIFRNRMLDWQDFLVRPDNKSQKRYVDLLNRLKAYPRQETFCAMVMKVEKPHALTYTDRNVKGKKIPIFRSEDNAHESIVPEVFVVGFQHDEYITHGFMQTGDYLVMGVPKVSTYNGFQGESVHTISIRLDSADSFLKVDLKDLAQTGLKKDTRRLRRATPDAHPEPPLQ